eukprot:SAG31_NODE_1002_length_10448_cov_27.630399_8_plen_70_part_00
MYRYENGAWPMHGNPAVSLARICVERRYGVKEVPRCSSIPIGRMARTSIDRLFHLRKVSYDGRGVNRLI